MLIAMNLGLLFLALVSTLTAFGGETWIKGDAPLMRRITRRGWISLACLIAAFALGATKQFVERAAAASASREAALQQQALQRQLTDARIENRKYKDEITAKVLDTVMSSFLLRGKSVFETFNRVIELDGKDRQEIPAEIFAGDQIHYYFENAGDILFMEIGGRTYTLCGSRIDRACTPSPIFVMGNYATPMKLVVKNPMHLRQPGKIAVLSADTTQIQEEFVRMLVETGYFDELKSKFRQVRVERSSVKSQPSNTAMELRAIGPGNVVRFLFSSGAGWSKVQLATGEMGFVRSDDLEALSAK